jgi:hypothetical protein
VKDGVWHRDQSHAVQVCKLILVAAIVALVLAGATIVASVLVAATVALVLVAATIVFVCIGATIHHQLRGWSQCVCTNIPRCAIVE